MKKIHTYVTRNKDEKHKYHYSVVDSCNMIFYHRFHIISQNKY